MRQLVPDLMLLFDGYRKMHGIYGTNLTDQGNGKMKGLAKTVKGDVTIQLWIRHLLGQQGLGIIPIDETCRVRFAAIDIDEYPLDLVALNALIQKHKLPLVLCRTKSGGAHLFLFLEQYHDAGEVQKRMREMASTIGHGNAEIFPKQTRIEADRGDVGNWINMPYFNVTDTQRYALGEEGNILTLEEFMRYARMKIVSYESLLNTTKTVQEDILKDGPPCLNHLMSMGFPSGTRNSGLFNIAVYCRKAFGDEWEAHVQEYNGKYMQPPLEPSEVSGILKSAAKKDFNFTCKQAPICNYCNMPKCRARKYGIGMQNMGMPKFGTLTKLKSEPPVWFLEVEDGGRLELTTDDLQNPRYFQNKCMEILNIMPAVPKIDVWQEIVQELLKDVCEVDVPEESTPSGQLWILLEDFCTSKAQARVAEEILLGKPWLHNGWYYFRLRDFMAFLDRQKFRAVPTSYIAAYLRDWKLQKKFWNLRGKGTNCHAISSDSFQRQIEKFETPPQISPEGAIT
jgi:hypothetical protein